MNRKSCEKKQRPDILERLGKALDVDCDMLCRGFSAELKGKNRAVLYGIKRIISYREEEMTFACADGVFFVRGSRLCCTVFKRGSVIVEGDIGRMGFEERLN